MTRTNTAVLIILLIVGVLLLWTVLILLHRSRKTNFGEEQVAANLKRLSGRRYRILNNIMIMEHSESTQIDHIVIGRSGIFVIETKNYKGTVVGNESSYQWHHYVGAQDYTFYNPCRQNEGHIRALRRLLRDYEDLPIYSMIAFPGSCTLNVESEYAAVLYWDECAKEIHRCRRDKYLSKEEVQEIAARLLEENADTRRNRKAHVKSVTEKQKRAASSIRRGRCPVCGSRLRLVLTMNGQYYACKNPSCGYTQSRRRLK